MTEQTNPAEPTADEIAAAQAVLARVAEATKAKVMQAMPAVEALVSGKDFPVMLKAATDLRDQLPPATPFYNHVVAMVVGMTNLQNDAAKVREANASAA